MKTWLHLRLSLDTHGLHAGEDFIVSASGMSAVAAFISLLNTGKRIVASESYNCISRRAVAYLLLSY